MDKELHIYKPPSEQTPLWRASRRAGTGHGRTPLENETEQRQQTARAARQRLWAADVACFYAKRRFDQSGRDADRQVWRARTQEAREAATALEAAEEALLRLPAPPPS